LVNGLYSAAAGMLGQLDYQDAIANNLANCNTVGYKRSAVSFSAVLVGTLDASSGSANSKSTSTQCVIPIPFLRHDSSQGLIEDTSVPTNIAIDGPGSFVVRSAQGERLTREGSFTLNNSGQLETSEHEPVMGVKGPIKISGKTWAIDLDGSVRVDGNVIDKIRIDGSPTPGQIIQGQLENSNVNTVQEMVSMITALRSYEAGQKCVQAIDQTLDKVINQVGRGA